MPLAGTLRKRTNIKQTRCSGYRARRSTAGGRAILNRRRAKGRYSLSV